MKRIMSGWISLIVFSLFISVAIVQAGESSFIGNNAIPDKPLSIIRNRIAAGGNHSLAMTDEGHLYTWGNNENGQLGNGKLGRSRMELFPVFIGDDTFVSVATGYAHSFAIKADGSLWGWGANQHGQLGDGTTVDKDHPIQIGTETGWVAVSAGFGHTLALKKDGSLYAWGLNNYGQLGDGTTVDKLEPTLIRNDIKWGTIVAGGYHSLAIDSDGLLVAWGLNDHGQLGDGTIVNRLTFTQPVLYGGWKAIAAGPFLSLAEGIHGDFCACG
jgi:alpha-tubulin suppressor-like RCC1 family protein